MYTKKSLIEVRRLRSDIEKAFVYIFHRNLRRITGIGILQLWGYREYL